jgi:release factor glutamine methyltransferase
VTTVLTDQPIDGPVPIRISSGVYAPQEDSALLIDALRVTGRAAGSRVPDLCSGSGAVALAAAARRRRRWLRLS